MRCPVCLLGPDADEAPCAACGARMAEPEGRELTGVRYLLGQLTVWERQGRIGATLAAGLRKEYEKRRDDLKAQLLPRVEPAPAPAPPPLPKPAPGPAPAPPPPPRPVVVAPPRPALVEASDGKPPFAWRDLCTERNVRWILNLGILIFSVALAVFIHTQWKSMAPGLKVSILFGSSAAAMGAGHLLRRTILKATGTALIVLGSVAVPIDFMALLQFGLIAPSHASTVGLLGSFASLGLYAGLVRCYREPLFEVLSTLAAVSTGAFALRVAGLEWPLVAPWVAPLAWAGTWIRRRPARWTSYALLAALASATLGLLLVGSLRPVAHVWPIEIAFAAAALAGARVRLRTGNSAWTWLTVGLLGLMFGIAAGALEWTWREARWPLALFGLVLAAGWLRRSPAFILGSVVASGLAVIASVPDLSAVAGVLWVPAAFHFALGLLRNDDRHVGAGGLLLGAALVSGLHGGHASPLSHPLYYAALGVGFAVLAKVRAREALHLLAATAAGGAMLLLAANYVEYYLLKLASPGQSEQLLGSVIAAVSAVAFGLIAKRLQSRYVSDVTFGCIGFAWILLLRWAYVPGKWLGLSIAILGVAYVLLEKRISKWLQRPSLFTGIACTVAASTFAFLQWAVWPDDHLQSSLTFLLVGAFYLAVAQRTPHRWLSHVGTYVATAGWLVGLRVLKIPLEMHALLTFLPAGWTILVAARRLDLHLGLAGLTVAAGALAFVYLDPTMYLKPNLPVTIAVSAAASALAGMLAFRRPGLPGVDVRLASGLMGAFAAAAYTFWMMYLSKGSPWGGLALFIMVGLLAAAGEGLRRSGLAAQGWPLAAVAFLFSFFALASAYGSGRPEGVHLWVHGLALVLFTALGRTFRLPALSWGAAATGVLGLGAWLYQWPDVEWIGILTTPLAALALQRRERPLAALGWVAAVVCPLHAATRLYEVPPAGLVFLGIAAAMAATRLRPVSYLAILLAAVISWGHAPYGTLVLFGGFALYLGVSLATRKPLVIVVSLLLALAADFSLAEKFPAHSGLVAFPLAFVLLAMAWETTRRFGREFGWPLLAASFAAAALSSALAIGHPSDRVWVFLADSLLFGVAAVLFRRPELMYLCSASVAALDVALMSRFGLGTTQTAFQLLTLSLAQVIFVRVMGERLRSYLQPVFVAALVVAAGVLVFGVGNRERYLDKENINLAIWGMLLLSLISGVAGRIKKVPAFLYLAAIHLLGAYYLTLHKYRAETVELYTVPIGIGLVAWSALAGVEKRTRTLGEGLAVGTLFLPSAIPSFSAGQELHTLLAIVLPVLLVLAGMGMKRRALLLGGTGAFVAEVLGQGLRFLIEQQLSFAEWGMIVGALLMLLAAAFESRKTAFVKGRLEPLRVEAGKYLSTLK